MGVYIKGMEMPKNCWECPCYHHKIDDGYYDYEICGANRTIFNDGYSSVTGHKDHIDPFKKRLDNCPLVPVPPHGDLIDREPFIQFIKTYWDSYDQWFVEQLEARPTIIPAEEGET